jgi:hypothetical protein
VKVFGWRPCTNGSTRAGGRRSEQGVSYASGMANPPWDTLRERDPKKLIPPLYGALLKNEQDVHLFERLAFIAKREGR